MTFSPRLIRHARKSDPRAVVSNDIHRPVNTTCVRTHKYTVLLHCVVADSERIDLQHRTPTGHPIRKQSAGEVGHEEISLPFSSRVGSRRVVPLSNSTQLGILATAKSSISSRIFSIMPAWDLKLSRAKHRVLIVEDSVPIQKGMKHWLEMHGQEVTVAGNGSEGLALLQQWKYDLVLTDFIMVSHGVWILSHLAVT